MFEYAKHAAAERPAALEVEGFVSDGKDGGEEHVEVASAEFGVGCERDFSLDEEYWPVEVPPFGRRDGEGEGELVRETKAEVVPEAESGITGELGLKRVASPSGDRAVAAAVGASDMELFRSGEAPSDTTPSAPPTPREPVEFEIA